MAEIKTKARIQLRQSFKLMDAPSTQREPRVELLESRHAEEFAEYLFEIHEPDDSPKPHKSDVDVNYAPLAPNEAHLLFKPLNASFSELSSIEVLFRKILQLCKFS